MVDAPGSSAAVDSPICGWFAQSHPQFRRDVLALARPRSCAAGSVIYQAGDVDHDIFGIS